MAKRELYHNLSVGTQVALAPAARTATVAIGSATTIDTYGFDAVLLQVICGAITDGTHTLSLYESDTDVTGNYTAVAAGDMLGSFAAISSSATSNQKVGYIGTRRYLRIVDTVSGATTGGIYSVVAICGVAMHKPVAVV